MTMPLMRPPRKNPVLRTPQMNLPPSARTATEPCSARTVEFFAKVIVLLAKCGEDLEMTRLGDGADGQGVDVSRGRRGPGSRSRK